MKTLLFHHLPLGRLILGILMDSTRRGAILSLMRHMNIIKNIQYGVLNGPPLHHPGKNQNGSVLHGMKARLGKLACNLVRSNPQPASKSIFELIQLAMVYIFSSCDSVVQIRNGGYKNISYHHAIFTKRQDQT